MRTVFSIILGLVVLLGLAIGEASAQTSTNRPVRLTAAMFTGYEFTLISDKDFVYYYFQDNGSVDETFGGKQKHSALVALGEGWRIDHGNTLVFTGVAEIPRPPGDTNAFPNPVRHTMQFKSFGKNIVVTTDGDRFRRSKLKRPN
jgi:hypothetical protein